MNDRVDPGPEALRLVRERPGHYTSRMLRAAVREASMMSKGDVHAAVQRLEDRGELVVRVNKAKSRKRRLRYYPGNANGNEPSRARVETVARDTHSRSLPKRPEGGKVLRVRRW